MGVRSKAGGFGAALALLAGFWFVGAGPAAADDVPGPIRTGPHTQPLVPRVKGGYYLSGNADIRPNTTARGMNLKSLTTYRSLYDNSIFPGYQKEWINELMAGGVEPNFVVELKLYGGPPSANVTCGGSTYPTPAANMTAGPRVGNSWAKYYGYDQVTSGKLDGLLCRAVQQLDALPAGPVTVQFASERDTDHEFGINLNGTAYNWAEADAMAIPAYTYLINYFKAHSTRAGTQYTVGMGGWDKESFLRSYVPAADRIQYNAYRRNAAQTPYDVFNRTYQWLAELPAESQSKDVVVAEWGTPSSLNDQAAWIPGVPDAISRLGRISMTNYFDANAGWGTLSPREPGLDALKAAYATVPLYANRPVPSSVPRPPN
jgi:hypothetical protein